MKNIKTVVLGRNYTSLLGMIRAVGKAGCDVTVIKSVRSFPKKSLKSFLKGAPIESKSKYVKKYLYTIESDREALINLILKECTEENEKVILLPTDDFTASTIDLYQDTLRDKFLFPNIMGKQGAVVKLMDKEYQKSLAAKLGLTVAKDWTIKIDNGEFTIPDDIVYPCFTKPEISFLGNKRCMKRCDNREELAEVLKEVAKEGNCPMLVEEYIEIENEYAVLGCCCKNKVIMPGIIKLLKSGNGAHKGVTMLGKIMCFDDFGNLYQDLYGFMQSLNFKGLFDIDFYENQGVYYFNELNLRFGASGYAITMSDINLPEIFINYLLNKNIPSDLPEIKKYKFANEKVNLEDFDAGFISWKEYKKTYEEADYRFILSSEDPKPYKVFKRLENYIRLKKKLKRK